MKSLPAIAFLVSLLFALGGIGFSQEQQVSSNPVDGFLLKSRLIKKQPFRPFSTNAVSLPLKMSYQGLVTTSGGTPVADGSYDMTISLYDSLVNGNLQWSEIHAGVPVHHGTFTIILGTTTPLNLQFNQPLFVQAALTNGPVGPPYPVVFPTRSELVSSPYSLAPWVTNGTDLYYKNGNIGIGSSAPESSKIGSLKIDIADEDGNNSDIAVRVAGQGNGTGFPLMHFAKSGGTIEVPTIAPANNAIGQIDFLGYDGTNYLDAAAITASFQGTPASSNMPGQLNFWTTPAGSASPSVRMHLDQSGNVGIGTTAPVGQLHVVGASPVRIVGEVSTLFDSEYVDFIARNSTYGSYMGGMRIKRDPLTGDVNTSFLAGPAGSPAIELMRLGGNGHLGIGTLNPIATLQTLSHNRYAGYFTTDSSAPSSLLTHVLHAEFTGSGATFPYAMWGRSAPQAGWGVGGHFEGGYSGVEGFSTLDGGSSNVGVIGDASGATLNYGMSGFADSGTYAIGLYGAAGGHASLNYGVYCTGDLAYTGALVHVSDAKFKENVESSNGSLEKIMELKPKIFTFKSGADYDRFSFPKGKQYGFIAQELEQVFPDLVVSAAQPAVTDAQGRIKTEPTEYKGVKTLDLIPILVNAIQEQQKLIDALQTKVANLEKK